MKIRMLALAAILCVPALTLAADNDAVRAESPYARAVPPTARNSGAFMVLRNTSDHPVRVVDARSDVSRVTELHTHINDKGVMRMRRVDFIGIPAHGKVQFQPGGYHVMLIELDHPLKPGDPVHLELTFGDGSRKVVELEARRTGMGMMHSMKQHGKPQPTHPMQH